MRKLAALVIALIGVSTLAGSPGLLFYVAILLSSLASGGTFTGHSAWIVVVGVVLVGCVPFALAVVLGVSLIANRERLSRRWFDDSPVGFVVGAESLFAPALALVGIAVGVGALSGVLLTIASFISQAASRTSQVGSALASRLLVSQLVSQIPSLLAELFTLVMGLVLIVRSKPISAWILRRSGDAEQPHPAERGELD